MITQAVFDEGITKAVHSPYNDSNAGIDDIRIHESKNLNLQSALNLKEALSHFDAKIKEVSNDDPQTDVNTGCSDLKMNKKSESHKVQQMNLNQSREYHSFFSSEEAQGGNEVEANTGTNTAGDNDEVKEQLGQREQREFSYEISNNQEESCVVDEVLTNRINEIGMVPNTSRHISSKSQVDQRMVDNRNNLTNYNPPPREFKNPFNFKLGFNPTEIWSLPVVEGFLKKRTTNVIPTWQTRYYVLENRKLLSYKTKEKTIIIGCLDFDLLTVKIEVSKSGKTFKIIPENAKREFSLKAESIEEAKKWIEALEQHRKKSEGSRMPLTRGVLRNRFWKFDRIAHSEFINQADTGDLLLFKAKHPNAKIQRSFTGSDYDHVGILLKYQSGEIVLFEAASKHGVTLCRWSTFLKNDWKKLYDRIMYRKLVMRRKAEIIDTIEEFIKNCVGKKYGISLTKLFKKKCNISEEEKKENRTFFCSELVAAFYKKIGILADDAAACGFLPGSFSSEKKIELINDARFEHEKLIDFNLEDDLDLA